MRRGKCGGDEKNFKYGEGNRNPAGSEEWTWFSDEIILPGDLYTAYKRPDDCDGISYAVKFLHTNLLLIPFVKKQIFIYLSIIFS